ncbi:MAG: hypothetical protein ABFC88_13495 [Thermoguttaceae bacterium]
MVILPLIGIALAVLLPIVQTISFFGFALAVVVLAAFVVGIAHLLNEDAKKHRNK